MTEREAAVTSRPDLDILADIHDLITRYPPLMHDRNRVEIAVNNGIVTLTGHIKSEMTEHWFITNLPLIAGVKQVVHDQLYNDDEIRLENAKYVPPRMFLNVEYGAVILTGQIEPSTDLEGVVQQIGQTRGVHRVITSFRD